jgi:hypothetical protein
MPVELEKRAMIGVEGFWKCGARDNVFAVEVLVKWPFRRIPLACAGFSCCQPGLFSSSHCSQDDDGGVALPGRIPAGVPKMACKVLTSSVLVSTIFSLSGRGMFGFQIV